jgi:hypothetical protein
VIIQRNGVHYAGWYELDGSILHVRAGRRSCRVPMDPQGPRPRDLARQVLHAMVAQARETAID